MVKNSLAAKRLILSLFQSMPKLRSAISAPPFYESHDIFIHLELACHDKQNGCQRFALRPRIAELWRFKGCKVKNNGKENHIAFFKAGLWRLGYFGCQEHDQPSESKLLAAHD